MATRERALLDAIDRPRYAGGIGEVSRIVGRAGPGLAWERLPELAGRWGESAIVQRSATSSICTTSNRHGRCARPLPPLGQKGVRVRLERARAGGGARKFLPFIRQLCSSYGLAGAVSVMVRKRVGRSKAPLLRAPIPHPP